MTEPFRPDDDLVSAVLDGEATRAERARVEGDPALQARLAEFAAVREAVGAPVRPPTEMRRDAAIAAALDAAPASAATSEAEVVPLPPRRDRREAGRFLAVAAAVLLVLLAAGFLADQMGGGDDAGDAGDDADVALDDAEDEASGGGDAESGMTAADELALLELPAAEDEAALRALLEEEAGFSPSTDAAATAPTTIPPAEEADDGRAETEPVAGDDPACQVRLEEADPGLAGLLLRASTRYEGTRAVVHLFGTVDGTQRVIVVGADDCVVLTAFTW